MSNRLPIAHPRGGRTELYLVRHGRTPGNVAQLLHGHTDAPLDDLGLSQADLVADRIGASVRADALLSSPLQRARTTAEAIGSRIGLTPQLHPGLMEMHFGDFEGWTYERFRVEHPTLSDRFLDMEDDEAHWPGGESRRDFHARVRWTFNEILRTHHDHTVIVVAHGGVFSSYLAQMHGISPNDWRVFSLHNCSVTHLEITHEHTWVHALNDVAHLVELMDATEKREPH